MGTVTPPGRSNSERRRRRPRPALLAAVAAAVLAAADPAGFAAFGQSSTARSIRDGVFSAEQVERGRESFTWECTDCHEIAEFTGPGAYLEEMEGEPLYDMFEFMWLEMPEDRPAWLPPEEYADILAYILSVYGMPAGEEDLPIDEDVLEHIVIEGPELPGS